MISLFGGTHQHHDAGRADHRHRRSGRRCHHRVENVFRRLREERSKARRPSAARPSMSCIAASSEVSNPIFFATLIIAFVFLPLFVLPGIEGRLLRPLGFAYIAALAASLLVSLTVTPVLCTCCCRTPKRLDREEPWLLRTMKQRYERDLDWVLSRPRAIYTVTGIAAAGRPGRSAIPGPEFPAAFQRRVAHGLCRECPGHHARRERRHRA